MPTDDVAKAREKESLDRQTDAHACARALSTLMLGERLNTGPESSVMAVPGGWIFYETHKAGISSTYVPAPSTPASAFDKKNPPIFMPAKG